MDNIGIARKIREIRKERGMTQADIAAYLNKTAATVSDIERGKIQVSAVDLYTLAIALNKPIEYFFGEEYDSEAIEDLVAIIRRQPHDQQKRVIQQTEMLLSLQRISDQITTEEAELSDEEISLAVKTIFSFADDIEIMYHKVLEIRKSLREAFNNSDINDIAQFTKENVK